jgi:hypothetical protein
MTCEYEPHRWVARSLSVFVVASGGMVARVQWEMALWGLFGGFAVEGLDFYRAFKAGSPMPWRERQTHGQRVPHGVLYLVVTVIRLAIGGGLALAAAQSDQVTTPLAAVAVGVAAPLIVERLLMTAGSAERDSVRPTASAASPDGPDVQVAGSPTVGLQPGVASEQ